MKVFFTVVDVDPLDVRRRQRAGTVVVVCAPTGQGQPATVVVGAFDVGSEYELGDEERDG